MKKFILLLLVLYTNASIAQEKTVSFIVAGLGKTIEKANEAALKSAVVQAYALFVSPDTTFFRDPAIVKEITSLPNDYIVKNENLSYLPISENDGFFCALKPQISIDKLTALAQRKNVSIEQKGGLFSLNINQQTLNETNEAQIISTLNDIVQKSYQTLFDYSIAVGTPKADRNNNKQWIIGLDIKLKATKKTEELINFIFSLIKEISLPISELNTYSDVEKVVYPVSMYIDDEHFAYSLLRNKQSRETLNNLITSITTSSLKFKINSGLDELALNDEEQRSYFREIIPFIVGGSNERGMIPYTYPITSNGDISTTKYQGTRAEEFFTNNEYYHENFPFIVKHLNEFIGYKKTEKYWKDPSYQYIDIFKADPGLVISFNKLKKDSVLLNVNYNDVRSLSELNKIQTYSIITPDVVLKNLYARYDLIKGAWQNISDTSDVIFFKDKKVMTLIFKNNRWTSKKDDIGNNVEQDYTLTEDCQNMVVFEDVEEGEEEEEKTEGEEENNLSEKKEIPNYLTFKRFNDCWEIIKITNDLLILKSKEGSEEKEYKRLKKIVIN